MAVVGGITGVRLFPRNYLSSKSSQLSLGMHNNRFCWRSGISSWTFSAAAAAVRAGTRVTLAQWRVERAGGGGRRLCAHSSYLQVHSSHISTYHTLIKKSTTTR